MRTFCLVGIVALLTFQALRRWGGDYYDVPTPSMEPFLHGAPDDGDRVFVRKLDRASDCRRGDVVVVAHPDDPGGLLVKRIAARGDDPEACWIEIEEGDVWLGPSRDALRREVKDPIADRLRRVRWAEFPGPPEATDRLDLGAAAELDGGRRLSLPPIDRRELSSALAHPDLDRFPRGAVGTAGVVDATYLTITGRRGTGGEDVEVFDCGMDVAVAASADEIAAGVSTRFSSFAFFWEPSRGRVRFFRNGEEIGEKVLPAFAGGHRIEFGHLDGRLFFVVDGRSGAMWCVPVEKAWRRTGALPRGPHTRLWLAALGDAPLEFSSLRVFRDLFSYRDRLLSLPGQPGGWPKFVPPGQWFLLGDNAFDSRDSRFFGPVPSSSFVGRPWFVLAPWARRRSLLP